MVTKFFPLFLQETLISCSVLLDFMEHNFSFPFYLKHLFSVEFLELNLGFYFFFY